MDMKPTAIVIQGYHCYQIIRKYTWKIGSVLNWFKAGASSVKTVILRMAHKERHS